MRDGVLHFPLLLACCTLPCHAMPTLAHCSVCWCVLDEGAAETSPEMSKVLGALSFLALGFDTFNSSWCVFFRW